MKGEKIEPRNIYWHFPAYLQSYSQRQDQQRDPLFRSRPCSVIRRGKWKLIEYFENKDIELFDLSEDIGEKNNLSTKKPSITKSLRTQLNDWRISTNARIPSKENPEYDKEAELNAIIKLQEKE